MCNKKKERGGGEGEEEVLQAEMVMGVFFFYNGPTVGELGGAILYSRCRLRD